MGDPQDDEATAMLKGPSVDVVKKNEVRNLRGTVLMSSTVDIEILIALSKAATLVAA